MLDDDDRRRAGQVVGNLLDRQNKMGTGEDPFALMKQLTDNIKQPSGNAGWGAPTGGFGSLTNNFGSSSNRKTNSLGMNMSSYAAFTKQVISQSEFAGTLSGTDFTHGLNSLKASARRNDPERNASPMGRFNHPKKVGSLGPMPELKVGGVTIKTGAVKDISELVKNKDIFDKANKRDSSVEASDRKPGEFYINLQSSKEAFHDAHKGKLPNLLGGEILTDPSGAFDRMISAKKEARD